MTRLVALGRQHGIPVFDDLGSGCLINLSDYGLQHEPTVQEVLATDVDVVSFSGDKLLGGPQAGIIAGKKDIVQKIKKNPLNRALRIDKFTLAALEATLMHYLTTEKAASSLRALKALTEGQGEVRKHARKLMNKLKKTNIPDLTYEIREDVAAAGGGSLPTQDIPTVVLAVRHKKVAASRMEVMLRQVPVPVIVRVNENEILIDLRTVSEDEFVFIVDALRRMSSN